MKLLKNSILLACLSVLFFTSCKNDLNINAPYKEIPSIYAVLNPFEKIQVIRVNKVFLGEGDANQMAQVADSINYPADVITVSLKHSVNPGEIVFKDSMLITDNGSFNQNQRVYVTNEKLARFGTYTLTVKNNHTGNVFTAVASPLDSVNAVASDAPLAPPYFPLAPGTDPNSNAYVNYAPVTTAGTKTNNVFIYPVPNAKIYKLVIRNHFVTPSPVTYDFVDFVVDNPKDLLNNRVRVRFTSADYYSSLGAALARKNVDKSVIGRKMWLLQYFVYASTQEFVDYNEFVKPSFSLNQNKPLYSNFKDNAALGLFTFRSSISVNKELTTPFINSFTYNSYTAPFFR